MTDLFSESNRRVPQSNFFKFESVGDKVSGILINKEEKQGSGAFPDQMIYTLEQADGETVKVGISIAKSGIIEILKPVPFGTLVGFKFVEQLKPRQAGYKGAKCIDVYVSDVKPSLKKVSKNDTVDDSNLPF